VERLSKRTTSEERMALYTEPINNLIKQFGKLPGIGQKTAERLTLYVLKASGAEAEALAKAIIEVKEKVGYCRICNNLSQGDVCQICQDEARDRSIICVVEEPHDIIAIEKTQKFRGRYHVLMGALSPLEGIGPGDLKVDQLLERIKSEKVSEVIIATNCDSEGEATALYLTNVLKPLSVKLTRIAHGIPLGSNLEYADQATLGQALEGRREL